MAQMQKPDNPEGDLKWFLTGLRDVLIILLGKIEDYLGVPHTILPREERRKHK